MLILSIAQLNFLSMKKITYALLIFSVVICNAQNSVAREWNEMTLIAIRNDLARPTVHARNLFHTSVVMYDAWALFDENAETVFLGKDFGGFNCVFTGIATPSSLDAAREEIMSYAMLRLLNHRFQNSPNGAFLLSEFETLFTTLGYDSNITSIDYSTGSYAALGNYMGAQMIAFGLQDNSNEQSNYANSFYTPFNPPLILENYYETNPIDPNHWQPLAFDVYVDQSGNEFPLSTPAFLGAEWGQVTPFALSSENLEIINNSFDCYVYNNPGPPVYIQDSNEDGISDPYKWNFAMVATWSSHLDPEDPTMIDISPASKGNMNILDLPETFEEYQAFYDFTNGGDSSTGYDLNPATGQPYETQLVKRADFGRVLAEYWADGPASETPPGHWFTILNYVSDHPSLEKRIAGEGDVVSDLEWDVKSYLALGGAMHDTAVNIWGIKGYYDYVRPISAIRYMAGKGQSSDSSLPSYDPHGLPLITGAIELITSGDPLSGDNDENVNRIKIKAWKGPDFIEDPTTDIAGVDWIIGTHWWPYQRGTFVTPNFAGYLSGHSTFSRAAAEVLTRLTDNPFFPDGMGTFNVTQNDFLFFETGPSEDMVLQWATYRDASDQASLSRIYGGIHPPIDDIRGRQLGYELGNSAFDLAQTYFQGSLSIPTINIADHISIFPMPFQDQLQIQNKNTSSYVMTFIGLDGKIITTSTIAADMNTLNLGHLNSGIYFAKFRDNHSGIQFTKKVVKY